MRKGWIEGIVFGLCALAAFGVLCGITACNISTDPNPHAPPIPDADAPIVMPPAESNVFISKPASDSDGNLVGVIPAQFTPENSLALALYYEAGIEVVASEHWTGPANGQRRNARFGQPGAWYGGPVRYALHLRDGQVRELRVPDCAVRWEREVTR